MTWPRVGPLDSFKMEVGHYKDQTFSLTLWRQGEEGSGDGLQKQGDPGSFQAGEHSNVLEGCVPRKDVKTPCTPPPPPHTCLMYFFHVAVPECLL